MSKSTQKDLILKYIHDFGSISSWQAYIDLGITQLATRIFELKQRGYIFEKENVKKNNRYGKPVTFSKYLLVGNINDVIGKGET